MNRRSRLDTLLVERGMFESRSRAAAAVMAGEVRTGPGRVPASKPGMLVAPDTEVEVAERRRYVSRGGQKLERALACSGIDVDRRVHGLPAPGRRSACDVRRRRLR
jgi:23S rRNA (cytidine1920-2'-O)/16S rRNA (cytidine1409-2'-O)-methyltransferase